MDDQGKRTSIRVRHGEFEEFTSLTGKMKRELESRSCYKMVSSHYNSF